MAAAPVSSVIVDDNSLSQWFGQYASAFVACGRGESQTASLLAYYGVPLLLTTDDGFFALTTGEQVLAAAQQQIDAMRAAGYARSQILDSGAAIVNSTTALYHQTFSRHRSDGSEISRGTTTYLVTGRPGRPPYFSAGGAQPLTPAGPFRATRTAVTMGDASGVRSGGGGAGWRTGVGFGCSARGGGDLGRISRAALAAPRRRGLAQRPGLPAGARDLFHVAGPGRGCAPVHRGLVAAGLAAR
jgi:hypothetical protein